VSAQPSEALAPVELIPEAPGFLISVVRRLRGDPLGLLGLLIVLTVIVLAVIGPSIAPYSPFKIKVPERFMPPTLLALVGGGDGIHGTFSHVFGTDNLGRDVFSRVLAGTQIALGVGGGSIAIALVIGLTLGLIAGYGPRWLDNFLMLLFDSIYSFPTVILGLTVMTLLGPSIPTLMFVVVVIQTPAYGRLIRTATLATKSSEYILAIRSLGSSPGRILLVHILPNIIGPLFIVASMDIPSVIALEAGLTYLGLGIPPPAPSWGRILQEGFEAIRDAPWIVVAGGIPLILTTLGFTFLGESLRDLLDPKLRRIV
jgi:peptide/nickel transport system permease protein